MEEVVKIKRQEMTPESIINKLSFFYEQVHHLHFNTKSYATHNALNFWEELTGFKDKIGELLLGYQAPVRFKTPEPIIFDTMLDETGTIKEVVTFARKLDDWAQEKNYRDLSNIAQELEGSAAKTLYMLSLK